jgi:hypothetical protein
MQIIQLQAENVKALTAVEITPDGKPVIITGSNGAGKSSILDAIFFALTNTGLDDPIRHGTTKAVVKLNLGEITIERSVKSGKAPVLSITTDKGLKVSSPQTLLDGLVGELTMDPLAFTRLKPAEQRDMLLRAAGVNVDDLDAQYKAVYDERTVANRLASTAQAKWTIMSDAPVGTPDKEVTATELEAEKSKLDGQATARQNALNLQSTKQTAVTNAKQVVAQRKARIAELEKELEDVRGDLGDAEEALTAATGDLNHIAIPAAPDAARLAEIKTKLASLSTTNAAVRQKQDKGAAKAEAEKAQRDAGALDTKLSCILQSKAERLASAKFGVPGLTVTDDGVMVDGVLFAQRSTAQQIETSMLLAMNQNPKLKIIMIRQGAMIGKPIFANIFALAKKHGFQVWVEKFQEEITSVGIHISHGAIVAVNGQPTSEPAREEE